MTTTMRRTLRAWVSAALFTGLLAGGAQGAWAQTDGRFTGAVLDSTGASVAGATVTVKNEKTGEERTAVTNEKGRYAITNLKPSVYTIRATFKEFAPIEYTGMPLAAAQEFLVDLTMRPAGVTEAVVVVATPDAIDVSSARLGVNVNERDVKHLPINGRQMSQLMLQAPGSVNSGTGTWQDVRFSGRAVEQNAIRYDGVEGSAIIDAAPGNLNGEVATPFKLQASLENVQEFRVESSNYPAEFGTGTGGQVNVVTKSGANDVHGSLFEYVRNDRFDSPNYFDTAAGLPKSKLSQHQFGGSIGGPIARNKAFFFASYEAYTLDAGLNFVEAVPSAAAWGRAVPAIAALRNGFLGKGAVILPNASANTDFDIAQLQSVAETREKAFSVRLDAKLNPSWSMYGRVFTDRGRNLSPEGVTGRTVKLTANPTNAVFGLVGLLSNTATNEFKVGYNAASTRINGIAPVVNGIDFGTITINLSGSVANTGIAGQGNTSGIAVPGGLVRANSATNGRGQPYDPFTVSVIDALSVVRGDHVIKVGGEFRAIRMSTDREGGTTYTFQNIGNFLSNTLQSTQYLGDVSAASPFNNGATGLRHVNQEYYVGYAQDEWHLRADSTLNYGLRYDYYSPLQEDNNLLVKWNIDTGVIDPNTTPLYKSRKNGLQPRVAFTYAPGRTVFRTGFGVFVGPGQTEDQIQPVESDRISSTVSGGSYPLDINKVVNDFGTNVNTRNFQPRAYANEYTIPERIYQYTASVQRELPWRMAFTAAYVGSQGRNLFLRSVANNIVQVLTHPDPTKAALVVREFSIPVKNAAGQITSVQNPFAEVDYKTSGGRDSYNALQLAFSKRTESGFSANVQYTLGRSRGNTAGSNEALTAANNARTLEDFDYDMGYNNFDVRHTFNFSALYHIPYGKGQRYGRDASGVAQAVLGDWEVGGILNARSGLPIFVQVVRPDVVYRDTATGILFANPAVGREAIINTPRGGASRNVRRPDLLPGVDPFIKDGGVQFLNPAAFAMPKPGEFGNLERNSISGPNFKQFDLVLAKRFVFSGSHSAEFRIEVFNLFNTVNFANPPGTLNSALPNDLTTEANRLQPGQAYTQAAAGSTWGKATSTVGRTVGLGTPRQAQFAVRWNF